VFFLILLFVARIVSLRSVPFRFVAARPLEREICGQTDAPQKGTRNGLSWFVFSFCVVWLFLVSRSELVCFLFLPIINRIVSIRSVPFRFDAVRPLDREICEQTATPTKGARNVVSWFVCSLCDVCLFLVFLSGLVFFIFLLKVPRIVSFISVPFRFVAARPLHSANSLARCFL
jgi:hypothetical protein